MPDTTTPTPAVDPATDLPKGSDTPADVTPTAPAPTDPQPIPAAEKHTLLNEVRDELAALGVFAEDVWLKIRDVFDAKHQEIAGDEATAAQETAQDDAKPAE